MSGKQDSFFGVILVLDEIDPLEDYFSFFRQLKVKKPLQDLSYSAGPIGTNTVPQESAEQTTRDVSAPPLFYEADALRTLSDTGYEVLDYFYTQRSIECASAPGEKMLRLPRKLSVRIQRDFAARLFGEFRLLVLAQ